MMIIIMADCRPKAYKNTKLTFGGLCNMYDIQLVGVFAHEFYAHHL